MADIKSHSTLTTNLVSYWDFEETSSGASAVTRYDLHGSNHLTDNNTCPSATGKIGNGIDFERTNSEYLSIADASQTGLDFSTALSFSLWYKPEGVTAPFCTLLGKRASSNESYYFAQTSSGLRLSVDKTGNGSTYDNLEITTTLTNGTWYHLVVTWDGSTKTAKFYVDGTQTGGDQTGTNVDTIYNGTAPFGNAIDGGFYQPDGVMDEVGVWSKVLTSGEITDLYNSGTPLPYYDPTDIKNNTLLATSLVSYWKLDETSGTRADAHGSNTLADSGAVSSATGILNNGADFVAASSDYISITDGSQSGLDITGNISVSMWIKTTSFGDKRPLSKWNNTGSEYGYEVYYNSTVLGFQWYNTTPSNGWFQSTISHSTATWYHICFSGNVTGSSGVVYVNGVRQAIGSSNYPAPAVIRNSTASFELGSRSGSSLHYDGVIDEVAVWSKALTEGEVRALYGYGTPPVYEAGGSTPAAYQRRSNLGLLGVA